MVTETEVVRAIEQMQEKLHLKAAKKYPKHWMLRRISSVSFLLFLINAPFAAGGLFFKESVELLDHLGKSTENDVFLLSVIILFVALAVVLTSQPYGCAKARAFAAFFLPVSFGLVLAIVFPKLVGLFAGCFLAICIGSYIINRLFGYTRAWSRLRTTSHRLDLLKTRLSLQGLSPFQAVHQYIQIMNDSNTEAHVDIIQDFHFFGDAVVKSLNQNKSK